MLFLTIDIGNTRSKAAIFTETGKAEVLWSCETKVLESSLEDWLAEVDEHAKLIVGWITTADMEVSAGWNLWKKFNTKPHFEAIRPTDSVLPIHVAYKTPHTLGADRLIAAIGACSYFPKSPVMVVDVGTAITYDCVDDSGTYLGGGISPGLNMRFRALHSFTAKLPLVAPSDSSPLLGTSTETSIQVGAQRGAIEEVRGMIKLYKKTFGPDLKVFLTGGDAYAFEKHLKKPNFARFHLLLEGIFLTLKYRLQSL